MEIKIILQKFCEYSNYIKGYTPDTIRRYKTSVERLYRVAKITQMEEINEKNVRNFFFFGRVECHWLPNSFINYHKSLKIFFRWCIKEGYMKSDPLLDIEMPRLEKRLPTRLTKQEAQKLLEVVYNFPYDYKFLRFRNHAIFAILLFAGLRKKELLNLKFADVDMENMSVYVRQGKGRKDRIIPICPRLAEILKVYVEERHRLKKTCPGFFVSLNHNEGLSENGLRHMLRKVLKVTGLKFSLHKLRHTFATFMIEGGCDIFSLSKMMGHSDIKTTSIYLAASVEHLRGQIMKHPLNDV